MALDPEEQREELIGVGGAFDHVADRHLASWDEDDWWERKAGEMLGISPDALKYTFVKDFVEGWRDTDWMAGTKRRERWRVQLSRRLTSEESDVIRKWFESLRKYEDSLEGFLQRIPKDVLVIRMRKRGTL